MTIQTSVWDATFKRWMTSEMNGTRKPWERYMHAKLYISYHSPKRRSKFYLSWSIKLWQNMPTLLFQLISLQQCTGVCQEIYFSWPPLWGIDVIRGGDGICVLQCWKILLLVFKAANPTTPQKRWFYCPTCTAASMVSVNQYSWMAWL